MRKEKEEGDRSKTGQGERRKIGKYKEGRTEKCVTINE